MSAMVGVAYGAEPILGVVKKAILRSIERDGFITPAAEAQVQRAVDLLKLEKCDPQHREQVEHISCTLREMHQWLLDGRVNAYASALLRLRRRVQAL